MMKIKTTFFLLTLASFIPFAAADTAPSACATWMGGPSLYAPHTTEESIVQNCDEASFTILSHEYARDKNHVYFKPIPNAANKTVILAEADPATFKISPHCPHLAIDHQHVFEHGRIRPAQKPAAIQTDDAACHTP